MSEISSINGPFMYFIVGLIAWLAVVAAVTMCMLNKGPKQEEEVKVSTKDRLWRKLQMAYKELFPSFTIEEKKAMAQLLEITTANAELFKKKSESEMESSFRKRNQRETVKRVAFKL